MTSMGPSRARRQPTKRPPWLIGVVVAVAVLVVIGLIFGVMSLFTGDSSGSTPTDAVVDPSASPCVTATFATSEILPDPSDVKINVYNSTAKTGLAKETAQSLSQRGFKILRVANDPEGKKISGVAQIRYGPKGELSAKLLLLYVPGAEMINDYRTGKKIDLSTGKTFSGLSPQQGVNALLAAPTPVASGPGCLPAAVLPSDGPASPAAS